MPGRAVGAILPGVKLLLRTPRLALRQFELGDLANLWTLYGDPEVMRHISLPTASWAALQERVLPDHLAEYERYRGPASSPAASGIGPQDEGARGVRRPVRAASGRAER